MKWNPPIPRTPLHVVFLMGHGAPCPYGGGLRAALHPPCFAGFASSPGDGKHDEDLIAVVQLLGQLVGESPHPVDKEENLGSKLPLLVV